MRVIAFMVFAVRVVQASGPVLDGSQEAAASLQIPVTLSGDAFFTHRLQTEDPKDSSSAAGLRAVISPTLRFGSHWFFYSALQVNSTPYFYYDAYDGNQFSLEFHALQAFVGYSTKIGGTSLLIKAGQLSSAFGSFPLQYDDAKNPLIDAPASYVTTLPLRPDQLPCGIRDLLSQHYGHNVLHYCGGSKSNGYGVLPASLYGLPGLEAELSRGRMDARVQMTNSSPANPQGFASSSQYLQWAAGGGYTLPAGLRLGMSVFGGPYLDSALNSLLPAGKTARDYPATALGAEAQWARGRWALNGEWQHFQFDSPRFLVSPSVNAAYGEVKSILSPRSYLALRAGVEIFGRVRDVSGASAKHWAPSQQVYEFAFGLRPSRYQLIKAGYEWVNGAGIQGTRDNVLGLQLVTTFTPVSYSLPRH